MVNAHLGHCAATTCCRITAVRSCHRHAMGSCAVAATYELCRLPRYPIIVTIPAVAGSYQSTLAGGCPEAPRQGARQNTLLHDCRLKSWVLRRVSETLLANPQLCTGTSHASESQVTHSSKIRAFKGASSMHAARHDQQCVRSTRYRLLRIHVC
jgi:hypothetical protein